MYSIEFRKEVMDYYYNVSRSQEKTATKYGVGKTTVSQWKQEDEGKKPRSRKVNCTSAPNEYDLTKYQLVTLNEEKVHFEINGFEIKIDSANLKLLLEGIKNDRFSGN